MWSSEQFGPLSSPLRWPVLIAVAALRQIRATTKLWSIAVAVAAVALFAAAALRLRQLRLSLSGWAAAAAAVAVAVASGAANAGMTRKEKQNNRNQIYRKSNSFKSGWSFAPESGPQHTRTGPDDGRSVYCRNQRRFFLLWTIVLVYSYHLSDWACCCWRFQRSIEWNGWTQNGTEHKSNKSIYCIFFYLGKWFGERTQWNLR